MRYIVWGRYPVRKCYSMHGCCLCEKAITLGQEYYDGGYRRRAHVECVGGER